MQGIHSAQSYFACFRFGSRNDGVVVIRPMADCAEKGFVKSLLHEIFCPYCFRQDLKLNKVAGCKLPLWVREKGESLYAQPAVLTTRGSNQNA